MSRFGRAVATWNWSNLTEALPYYRRLVPSPTVNYMKPICKEIYTIHIPTAVGFQISPPKNSIFILHEASISEVFPTHNRTPTRREHSVKIELEPFFPGPASVIREIGRVSNKPAVVNAVAIPDVYPTVRSGDNDIHVPIVRTLSPVPKKKKKKKRRRVGSSGQSSSPFVRAGELRAPPEGSTQHCG